MHVYELKKNFVLRNAISRFSINAVESISWPNDKNHRPRYRRCKILTL
jgi:hypothetical protein